MYKSGAVFIGILVSLMVLCNGMLAQYYGNSTSLVILHSVGLINIIIYLVLKKEKLRINRKIPFYLFLGGAVGVILVSFNNLCFQAIGVSLTIALGLFGQTFMSIVVDHLGLFGMKKHPFNINKLVGLSLIFIGIFVMTIK